MAKADDIQTMLSRLPEEDRENARLLLEKVYEAVPEDQSIFPAPQTSKKIPKNTLEEYYLAVETTCKLCEAVIPTFFLMKENNRGGLGSTQLEQLPTNKEEIGDRTVRLEQKQVLTCQRCSGRLFMWPTQKLINELIKARGMK